MLELWWPTKGQTLKDRTCVHLYAAQASCFLRQDDAGLHNALETARIHGPWSWYETLACQPCQRIYIHTSMCDNWRLVNIVSRRILQTWKFHSKLLLLSQYQNNFKSHIITVRHARSQMSEVFWHRIRSNGWQKLSQSCNTPQKRAFRHRRMSCRPSGCKGNTKKIEKLASTLTEVLFHSVSHRHGYSKPNAGAAQKNAGSDHERVYRIFLRKI